MQMKHIAYARLAGAVIGLAWFYHGTHRASLRAENRRLNLAIDKQGEWMTYLEHKLAENNIEMDEFDLIAFNKILQDLREGV